MKHPIDEQKKEEKNIPPEIAQASAKYKADRDQILAIKDTTWYRLIMEWHFREQERAKKELLTASLNIDDDKKHLLTVRWEYNIVDKFLAFIDNLQKSKDRE